MPRVENLGPSVDAWAKAAGDPSSTYDVCMECYAELLEDPHQFDESLRPFHNKEPQGENGWAGDVDHPEYTDERCAVCHQWVKEAHDTY